MNKKEALTVIKDHQKWRRSKPPYNTFPRKARHSEGQVTMAIEVAIRSLESEVDYINKKATKIVFTEAE